MKARSSRSRIVISLAAYLMRILAGRHDARTCGSYAMSAVSPMCELRRRKLSDCNSDEMVAAFLAIFEDFVVPVPTGFDGAAFERRFAFEHLDRGTSALLTLGSEAVGTILVARRGRTTHISGLGVAQNHRRRGVAKSMLGAVIDDALRRGDRRILVEVPEASAVARALYDGFGFTIRRRLIGFSGHLEPDIESHVEEVDVQAVADAITCEGPADLPWFFHPASLMGCSLPTRAFALDARAFAIVTARGGEMHLRSLFVRPMHRRRGLATRLLRELAHHQRTTSCAMQPLIPEGLTDAFFATLHFDRMLTTHLELERRLP